MNAHEFLIGLAALEGSGSPPARATASTSRGSSTGSSTGGYSGVFLDPDRHPWEVAHNPGWTLADDGSVALGT